MHIKIPHNTKAETWSALCPCLARRRRTVLLQIEDLFTREEGHLMRFVRLRRFSRAADFTSGLGPRPNRHPIQGLQAAIIASVAMAAFQLPSLLLSHWLAQPLMAFSLVIGLLRLPRLCPTTSRNQPGHTYANARGLGHQSTSTANLRHRGCLRLLPGHEDASKHCKPADTQGAQNLVGPLDTVFGGRDWLRHGRDCKMIRVRYLWIDCLCIIQDDEQDWRREVAWM
jgi:hypothetical protein